VGKTRIAAIFAAALVSMFGAASCGGGSEGEAQRAEQLEQRMEQLEQQVEQQQQQLDEQQKLLDQQIRETVEEEVNPR
jgi:DNA anti-recombination protein RmuC